jgi:type II secretory pathway component GspD/PulD (secretin)
MFKTLLTFLIFTMQMLQPLCWGQDNSSVAEQSGQVPVQPDTGISFQPVPPTPAKVNTSTDSISGEKKISLDLKGMDIVDVLKIFSQEGSLNIVVGRLVNGKVTIFLKDVDLWDAFLVILSSCSLAYEKTGDIINVMSDRDYEATYGKKFDDRRKTLILPLKYAKAAGLAQALSQMKSGIGLVMADESTNALVVMDTPEKLQEISRLVTSFDRPMETRAFSLNYAKAEDIANRFKDIASKGSSSVSLDARTNKIVVTDYPEKIKSMEEVALSFDEKNRQVLINAQIIEITPVQEEFKMGVNWDYWIAKNVRVASSLPMGSPNTASAGMAAGTLTLTEPKEYKSVVDALHTIGKTKILSSPRIMALNNQEAKILVGTKEAYLTDSISQPASGTAITATQVNFVDVGVQLFVTPTINKEGFVTMKIRPVISSADYKSLTSADKTTQVPIVSTSEAETSITVKDGVTVMIAGLKKDQKQHDESRLPILGDIPFLGAFFRSTHDSVTKTELVIFLTPSIVSGETPVGYQSLSEDKDITEKTPKVPVNK